MNLISLKKLAMTESKKRINVPEARRRLEETLKECARKFKIARMRTLSKGGPIVFD